MMDNMLPAGLLFSVVNSMDVKVFGLIAMSFFMFGCICMVIGMAGKLFQKASTVSFWITVGAVFVLLLACTPVWDVVIMKAWFFRDAVMWLRESMLDVSGKAMEAAADVATAAAKEAVVAE
jgi:hypothetical protein